MTPSQYKPIQNLWAYKQQLAVLAWQILSYNQVHTHYTKHRDKLQVPLIRTASGQ